MIVSTSLSVTSKNFRWLDPPQTPKKSEQYRCQPVCLGNTCVCRLGGVESIYTSVSARYVVRCPEWQRDTDQINAALRSRCVILRLATCASPIRVRETQSTFHPHAQRNTFGRDAGEANVIETHEHNGDFSSALSRQRRVGCASTARDEIPVAVPIKSHLRS